MDEADFEIEEHDESENESIVDDKPVKTGGAEELDDSDVDFDDDSENNSEFDGGAGSETGSDIENDDEDAEIDITVDRKRKSSSLVEEVDYEGEDDEDEEEEEEEDENYLQKLDEQYHKKVIENFHPELKTINYEEVESLATVVRDKDNNIIDPLHRTLPILSRYERARILGERAKQINSGAKPFIDVDPSMIDGYLIALKELDEKRIPFIIQRPLPNGASEYWRVADLETL
jgi:DNA-directed RNA polymerase I, II, and III subunit RPABC2